MDESLTRCWWAAGDAVDPLMADYHDTEWGVPTADDRELFERLTLECFQAGLSWSLILHKRAGFRAAFRGFEPAVVAAYGEADVARLLADPDIVRNGAKIRATIGNAAAVLQRQAESGSFAAFLAPYGQRPPRQLPRCATATEVPATSPASDALSAALRDRGFRFVGSTVVYAFMQSVGLVDDHMPGCFRYGASAQDRPR
ncbi:MAG: DNA-3-methyladenine glycosylase I [Candidatus Limnocylindrales bacterium]